jgi:protease-4
MVGIKIAVVVAEGEIVYGKGNSDQVSSDEYLTLLRKLRNDKSIKGIVLRIN